MQEPFKRGEKVKLTTRGLRVYRGYLGNYERRNDFSWNDRRGTVLRYKCTGEAIVVWDGRKTSDPVSIRILERA